MTEQERQITELNSTIKCKLAPSKIHGIGVFAIRDIQAGERVYARPDGMAHHWYSVPYGSLGKLFPEVREVVLTQWPSIVNGSHFTSPNDVWPILFMNHQDDPNYEVKTDCAIKDIKKGEEITENYRLMLNYEKIYPWLKPLPSSVTSAASSAIPTTSAPMFSPYWLWMSINGWAK